MVGRRQRICERAYALWEAEGRSQGNDWAHWFLAEREIPSIRVTFDSNSWQPVVRPDKFAKDPRFADFLKLKGALLSGDIQGFVCETVATLEAIQKTDRGPYFSGQRVSPKFDVQEGPGGTIKIDMKIAPDDGVHPGLPGVLSDRLRDATSIYKMSLLRVPRIGLPRPDEISSLFAPEPNEAVSRRQNETFEVMRAVEQRGVGIAQAKALGKGIASRMKKQGPWYQFLDHPKDQEEANKIKKAVAEWADGDAVAAHIGYANDLFCTEDKAKGAGRASVFDPDNRAWLQTTYGVKYVTLSELATMVGQ